jgi:beta-glucanase (GH16 family)
MKHTIYKYLFHFRSFLFAALIISFACLSSCSKKEDPKPAEETYELVWSDEFDIDGAPDASKWTYDIGGSGWGNSEAQYYTSNLKNSEIKNGFLYINALMEDFEGKKYTSARLVTKSKGDWTYGKVEVRAKLPQGRGLWPAIWMLPTDWEYGGWPDSGEIDIMENLGYIPYWISGTVQTKSYNFLQSSQKQAITGVSDCYTEFHSYILEWESDEIRIYVDSKLYLTFKDEGTGFEVWPFDKRFHLLLNVAVGGTFGGANGIDDNIFPQSMVVDYVRVYQKK